MISRIGSYTFTSQNTSRLIKSQQELIDLQVQVATGKRSQDYKGISANSRQLINLENSVNNAEQNLAQNNRVDLDIKAYNAAIEALTALAYEAKSLYNSSVGSGADPTDQVFDPRERAFDLLKEVEAQLNLKIDGDYLFGGGRTNAKPVTLPNDQATLSGEIGGAGQPYELNGTATAFADTALNQTYYYDGDNIDLTYRASDDVELDFAMRANETAFQDLIGALSVMIDNPNAHPDPADAATVDFIESLLTNAISELGTQAQKLGFAANQLQKVNNELESFITFTQNEIEEIESIDPTEAVVRLQQSSLNLEISYQATARINQLSIANFI
tara:strand:+ start:3198 stop:4187 length:990 start_codon:yes stop_codon:yes gene_type:complete